MESGWDGHSVRISYNKYPTLPGVILSLLQSADKSLDEVSSSAAEAVFPALDIIRRAGPPDEHRAELRRYIEGYLSSRIWHVREIVARTLCSFLLRDDWVAEISRLVVEGEKLGANRLHGILLTLRFVIERKLDLRDDVDVGMSSLFPPRRRGILILPIDQDKLTDLLDLLADRISAGRCPENEAALLEILNLLPQPQQATPSPVADIETTIPSTENHQHALLAMHSSLHLLHTTPSVSTLGEHVLSLLLPNNGADSDVNTATRLLESLPSIIPTTSTTTKDLCTLYAKIITHAVSAPEARAQALLNLSAIIDSTLTGANGDIDALPSADTIQQAWNSLQAKGEMNPTLSCAVIRASGCFMALLGHKTTNPDSKVEDHRLRSWGQMISNALEIDNVSPPPPPHPHHH